MAMRRPRIKAAANLMNIKRKRTQDQEDLQAKGVKNITEDNSNNATRTEERTNEPKSPISDRLSIVRTESVITGSNNNVDNSESTVSRLKPNANAGVETNKTETTNSPELTQEATFFTSQLATSYSPNEFAIAVCEDESNKITKDMLMPKTEMDNNSFKCPPKVDYNRSINQHMSTGNSDNVLHTDMEMNVIQMDLQKSTNGFPMSPSKTQARQRIRPTPVFGQRRNSFVASSSPSPHTGDDFGGATPEFVAPTHRRERHYSASLSQTSSLQSSSHHYHKFAPTMGMGRIRTESGCSTFSDSYTLSGKTRKTDEYNHRNLTRRDFEARFTKGVPDKSTLKMFDLIYYNPATNPMEQKSNITNIKRESSQVEHAAATGNDKSEGDMPEAGEKTAAMPVPQLKLNSSGELILDDKSLEIETTAEQEARKVLANSSLIFLDENTGMNGFYKRQKRTKEWLPEETIKFYRCLQTVGTDFSLMCQLFPKRTRRDLKLKFKKEERCNGSLINKALLYPKNFNIEELKEQLDAEECEREEAERKWKEIKSKEAKLAKKVIIKTSNAARALKEGDDIYRNEHVIKRKFSKRAANNLNELKKVDPFVKQQGEITSNSQGVDKKPKAKRTASLKRTIVVNINEDNAPTVPIKMEATIKSEQHDNRISNVNVEPVNLIDATQLESELSDLLQQADVVQHHLLHRTNSVIAMDSATILLDGQPNEYTHELNSHNNTLINLDDGTVSFLNELDTLPATLTTPMAAASESSAFSPYCVRDLDETDIQHMLTELADGSLVLVSTLDPDNADKVLNEIYMVNKDTGELYDEPLEIPEVIVQGILSVMS